MIGHLGPLAAALVDDQLDTSSREKALRHVAACGQCRFEVEQQRAVKARLDDMGEPQLPSALLDKLQAMRLPSPGPGASASSPTGAPPSSVGPVGAGPDAFGGTLPRTTGLPRPSAAPTFPPPGSGRTLPAALLAPRAGARRRVRNVLVGATSLVLLGGGAAYAAGGDAEGAPVRPPVDVYTVQHGTTGGTVPLDDPAVDAVTAGFGR